MSAADAILFGFLTVTLLGVIYIQSLTDTLNLEHIRSLYRNVDGWEDVATRWRKLAQAAYEGGEAWKKPAKEDPEWYWS